MAKFVVEDVFKILGRNWFVIAGRILEGKIKIGMYIEFPEAFNLDGPKCIEGIEMIHTQGEKRGAIGLGVYYRDEAEWQKLHALPWQGIELMVVEQLE